MPIIQIRALPQKSGIDIPHVLQTSCVEVANVMQIPVHHIWANWETLQNYVEGDRSVSIQPESTHPPIVQLIMFEGRSVALIEKIMETIATTLCNTLHLQAGNVYILYTEAKAGLIHTGGKIRRSL
ncbi:MAG: hypothetical protein AABZ60_05370 [Planctomycetota bacterium]